MFEVVFGIDEATTDKQLLAGLRNAAANYDDALADLRCLVGSVVDGVRWLTFLGSARMNAGFFEESLQPHQIIADSYLSVGDLGRLNVPQLPAKYVTFSGFSAATIKRLQKGLR